MDPTDIGSAGRTRREYLRYGGAVATAGLLAGCTGGEGSGSATDTTGADPATATAETTESATEGDGEEYAVSMAPMGEVTFERPPESWMAYFSTYGDMALALGRWEDATGLIFTDNWPTELVNSLPDVEVDFEGITQLMGEGGIDKELFYELDSDVHLFDPNFVQILDDGWTDEEFAEVAENVGPIVGNSIRRRGADWHDYRYYDLYEAFEKVAEVFRERERYEAVAELHAGLQTDIAENLPPAEERPTVGLLSVNSDFEGGSFYAYPVHDGNGHKQYRDLGIRGAFDDLIEGSYAEWDYEQLLEADPDVLLFQYGLSHVSTEEFEARMETMREDDVGSQLSAVQNDRLYRGGTSYQGPVINLLQTEVAAKQFYPETFGDWHGIGEVPEDERLFDHDALAAVITGEA
ncbi:ABC transporter substrate-binding protein [Haloparvum alkalitolerans]|uniref:ABC transporter substrate-binding protein n=1 Tax=Haloparvum alkalitolerans TaxID=1042953 RepID=UPI003CEDDAFF